MPSSTYTALNGREIRDIVKNKIIAHIDKLPYLREGNSFHRANVQFGFVMSAYPADVPVPDASELEFKIDAKSIEEFEDALNRIEKADDLANKIQEMQELKIQLDSLIDQALEAQSMRLYETQLQDSIDGTKPDVARIEADLPITVEEVKGGKRVETKVPALEFKKMAKL